MPVIDEGLVPSRFGGNRELLCESIPVSLDQGPEPPHDIRRAPGSGDISTEFALFHPVNWYALTVEPQHEKVVGRRLSELGYESFVPLYRTRRRWSDRVKELELPLFSTYVFSRFPFHNRVPILRVPGVRSVVSARNAPAPVRDEEIEAIRGIVASGLPVQPWPCLKTGQRVLIDSGPLRGIEGTLTQFKRTWHVVVSLELLNRAVAVELDRELVVPISALPRA